MDDICGQLKSICYLLLKLSKKTVTGDGAEKVGEDQVMEALSPTPSDQNFISWIIKKQM